LSHIISKLAKAFLYITIISLDTFFAGSFHWKFSLDFHWMFTAFSLHFHCIFTAFSLHFHCIDNLSLEVSLDVGASLSLEVSDITLPRDVRFYVHVEI
jgi:hypothetical protein